MSEKRFTIEKIFKEYPKLRDNETECFYHLVDNERNAEIFCERLNNLVEENEQLREKVTDYEIILSITDDKRTLCKEQQIDDVAFYCERYSDYRCYPLCPNTKDCFKADGTFQEKLKDLKEFWGEKWK